MKGAFELALIMLFAFPMVILGVNFVEILMSYNQARYLQDYAISTIEHQNRYDDNIEQLIDDHAQKYPQLDIQVQNDHSRYLVSVTFPVKIALIGYDQQGIVSTLTQIIR